MKQAIAIGMLGLALFSNRAAAQTAVEKDAILGDFQRSVAEYTQRHSLAMFPEAASAAADTPKIFTLPVAMVFRQLIAHNFGAETPNPQLLREVLPALPDSLEYRLLDHDLVIRDTAANMTVAILREAVGNHAIR